MLCTGTRGVLRHLHGATARWPLHVGITALAQALGQQIAQAAPPMALPAMLRAAEAEMRQAAQAALQAAP